MADQVEKIILEAGDNTGAATRSANKNIESVENSAEAASQAVQKNLDKSAAAVVTITDRSKRAMERIVAQAESRAVSTRDPIARLTQQRDNAIAKVKSDQALVDRVTAAYNEMIGAATKAAEAERRRQETAARDRSTAQLERAIAASQKATRGEADFAAAVAKTTEAYKRQEAARASAQRYTSDVQTYKRNELLLDKAVAASQRASRGGLEFETALNKTTEAYKRQEAARVSSQQYSADLKVYKQNELLLERAIAASQKATRGAAEFAAALNRQKAAAQESSAAIEKEISVLERRAAVAGRTRTQRAVIESQSSLGTLQGRGATPEQIDRATAAYRRLIQAEAEAQQKSEGFGGSLLDFAGRLGIVLGATELLRKALSTAFDSTLYAARTEQLGVALNAVGSANKVAESTTATLEARLVKLGVTTQEARQSLTRLIGAQVDYTKVEQLARTAQNLGRVANINSSEAFERLTHAIVTQQPELLRTLGLNVNLEREFQVVAHAQQRSVESLTELEKKQIAVNAVLRAAQGFNGVYGRSLDTAGGQLLSFRRYVDEAKNSFGNEFLPELAAGVGVLNELGKRGVEVGSILAKLVRFNLAALSPIGLAAGAATPPKPPRNLSDEEIRKSLEFDNRKLLNEKLSEATNKDLIKQGEIIERARIERAERETKDRKQLDQLYRESITFREEAERKEADGLDRIAAKRSQMLADVQKQMAGFLDANSFDRDIAAKARGNIERGAALERKDYLEDFQKKWRAAFDKFQVDSKKRRREMELEELQRAADITESINTLFEQTRATRNAADIDALEAQRDAELRNVRDTAGQGLAVRLAAEAEVAKITNDYSLQIFAKRAELIDIEANERAALARNEFEREAILNEATAKAQRLEAATQQQLDATRQQAAIRQRDLIVGEYTRIFDSLKRQSETVVDQIFSKSKNIFEAIGGVIKTALLTAMKDVVTSRVAAALTELVTGEKVTLRVPPGNAGPLGRVLGSLGLGARPVFGKLEQPGHLGDLTLRNGAVPVVIENLPARESAVPAQPSGATQSAGLGGLIGALAGFGAAGAISARTPPFVQGGRVSSTIDYGGGPISTGDPRTVSGAGGTLGQVSNPFSLAGLRGGLRSLGNLGRRTPPIAPGPGSSGGAFDAGRGVGGTAGGALLLGGGILAFDGLRRGGKAGLLETTLGGALIGAKFGGPIGAAIGAGIGAVAGLIRLGLKGKTERLIERVKALHRITISKEFARDPLQKMIDQNYGGNIEVGLRSPEVVDLLRLYARSTGQDFSLDNRPQAVGLALQGGILRQTAAQVNGGAVAYSGGTARLAGPVDRLITGTTPGQFGEAPSITVKSLSLNLDGQAATTLLKGEVARDPGLIGKATIAAAKASINRRELTVAQSTPGLITA